MDQTLFSHLIQHHFPGAALLRAWTLSGGISAQTTALEIRRPDGQTRKWILRQPGVAALLHNPHASLDEFRVLEIAHTAGLSVPAPILLDTSGQYLPDPYLIMEYLDGQIDFAPADPVECASQMAYELARIHAVPGSRPDLSFLPKYEENSERSPHSPEQDESLQEGRIRRALADTTPFPHRNAFALLHGDYWPGNILWQSGRLSGIIDWEDAALGDPLADLAVARLDLLWIYGRAAMETFTRRYLSLSPLDTFALPLWDLHAALRLRRLAGNDLPGWAAFFHPYGRTDITEQSIREAYGWFVDQALSNL